MIGKADRHILADYLMDGKLVALQEHLKIFLKEILAQASNRVMNLLSLVVEYGRVDLGAVLLHASTVKAYEQDVSIETVKFLH